MQDYIKSLATICEAPCSWNSATTLQPFICISWAVHCSLISFHLLPLVQLHVAILAATLQPFICISLQPHFINICSIACCTLLLPCFGAALPSFHFAATRAVFFPFAASCAALTPQLQQRVPYISSVLENKVN
ncbi:hypothetical protein SLA2020_089550 [Shorea laevis]